MPAGLERGDRTFLIAAAVALAALTAAALVLEPGKEPPERYPSSYTTGNAGAKAAYTLLETLGYRVERWNRPPGELPARGGVVLVLADPALAASAEERNALRTFVVRGGSVLATGAAGAELLNESGPAEVHASFDWQSLKAEAPSPLTLGAPEVSMQGAIRWAHPRPGVLRCYGDAEGAAVAELALGQGSIVWWADSSPLTNYGITRASNLALLLNSVRAPRGAQPTEVLWDEYFHGDRRGFWSYVGGTPAPWLLLQLGVVFAAVLLSSARRSGPVRALPRASRMSPLEFVETQGDLYRRKGAAGAALGVVYQRFRFLLARRLGLQPSAAAQDLFRSARERLGWRVPGLWETIRQCELASNDAALGDVRALHLIQELHDYTRRLGLQA